MTAGRDALRERLLAALAARHGCDTLLSTRFCNWCLLSADALLPVAERFAAEQVAAALNDAADEVPRFSPAVIAHWLRARAAAVLAAPDNDRRQG